MMSKDRKRLSTKLWESILRVRNYREILSGICYEQALELFLTEYPNGKTPRGKCRSAGHATSSKAIAQAEKKRGLTLTMEDSDVEMNRDGENETAPSYSWRALT